MGNKETKTEEFFNWDKLSLDKKEVHYEDGKKVGETKHETTWTGKPIDKTYDSKGDKVSETRYEETLFSGTVGKTRDTEGNLISKTYGDPRIFDDTIDRVIYEDGKEIGRLRRDDRLFGRHDERRRILIEKKGKDVDLLRRSAREKEQEKKAYLLAIWNTDLNATIIVAGTNSINTACKISATAVNPCNAPAPKLATITRVSPASKNWFVSLSETFKKPTINPKIISIVLTKPSTLPIAPKITARTKPTKNDHPPIKSPLLTLGAL